MAPPPSRAPAVDEEPAADERGGAAVPRLVDVAGEAGLRFEHFADQVPGRFFLPEVMGSGLAWLDFDGDGRLDLYLANGSRLDPAEATSGEFTNALYHQQQPGRFVDVTAAAAAGDAGYGQGVAVGDFDADGFADLYVANYGGNVLLHNNGDGTFSDVTRRGGVAGGAWSSSVVWADLDGDQLLDLYVVRYVDVTLENNQVCQAHGAARYCGPEKYAALPDLVFWNRGDGTFVEAAQRLGLAAAEGKGLGVAVVDFDDDLAVEIYVANDMRPNFLFSRSAPGGRGELSAEYSNRASAAGCAVSDKGEHEASMGVACGDFDGDGRVDIFLTHFLAEKNTLYRNLGRLTFSDDSRRANIAATSFDRLGFGTVPLDYDRNGTLDLFVANGHVFGPLQRPHEMRPQLLSGDGRGRFADVSDAAGEYFQQLWLGRGAAGADYDNDGDLDVAVSHAGRPAALLRNDTDAAQHFIGFELRTRARLPAAGGRVVVRSAAGEQTLPVVAGGSYLSTHDARLLCGLGAAGQAVQVEIHWPSGHVDALADVEVDRYWLILEGSPPQPAPLP